MNDEALQGQFADLVLSTSKKIDSKIDAVYEILEEINTGGMGLVYKAKQRNLERVCAIKVMRRGSLEEEDSFRRFVQEAKLVCTLDHPNIVKVFSVDLNEQSNACFVMEWLDGASLAQILKQKGRLSIAEFRNIFSQILQALAYAHQRGVIHRDLKPGNIFVCDAVDDANLQMVKLLDFGIAKDTSNTRDDKLTRTGTLLGTPAYISPEQARGEAAVTASDVYSLGVLMYECLTGQPPFSGDTALEVMYKHMKEAVDTSKLPANAKYSKLNACIAKCLEKEASKRFSSAAELLEEISKCWDLPDWNESRHSFRKGVIAFAISSAVCLLAVFAYVCLSVKKGSEENESAASLRQRSGLQGFRQAEACLQEYENYKTTKKFKLAKQTKQVALKSFDDWIQDSNDEIKTLRAKIEASNNKAEQRRLVDWLNSTNNNIYTAEMKLGDFFRKEGDLPESARRYGAAFQRLSCGDLHLADDALIKESEVLRQAKQFKTALEILKQEREKMDSASSSSFTQLEIIKIDAAIAATIYDLGNLEEARKKYLDALFRVKQLPKDYQQTVQELFPDLLIEIVDGLIKTSRGEEQAQWYKQEYRLFNEAELTLNSTHEVVHGQPTFTRISREACQRIAKCCRSASRYFSETGDAKRGEELSSFAHEFELVR